MVEDYSLVSFQLLNVRSTESLLRLRNHIDKANGYVYKAGEEQSVNTLLACAVNAETEVTRQNKDIEPYMLLLLAGITALVAATKPEINDLFISEEIK
uniref:Uncharacterized protein n=1 Tax=Glossina morsitans morsitans TaxID=37546 RepID=A0A1B0G641_GLOMM